MIVDEVPCDTKFQGASLLADETDYFKLEPSCLYLRMFLVTLKCNLLYLGQNLCKFQELLMNKFPVWATFGGQK